MVCAVVRALASHQSVPGSIPAPGMIRRGYTVELVVGPLLAPRFFSPGSPVFPFPQKPRLPNSNSIRNAQTRVERAPLTVYHG